MAKKGPMPTYETIDDYIAAQAEPAQKILTELREAIKEAVPEAEEVKNIKAPLFTLIPGEKREHQLMMAAYAKYVSFYPNTSTMEAFSDELEDYKLGKGTIQIPFDKPLPKNIVIRMVRYRLDEILEGEGI
jgi:uncharacterized protein YdhG (YjbR/CyaY superfamily)